MENSKVQMNINDVTGDNKRKLQLLFPNVFKDGEVDIDALMGELGMPETTGAEKYELNWVGKKEAKMIARTDVNGKTLVFDAESSCRGDETENLYIEGDNLEVLKLIRQNYYSAVKMIYIDPPYNTGSDFIYNDSFVMEKDISDLGEGLQSESGERFSVNSGSQNRYHANWLSMMYPRLQLAKDLLDDTGVIYISIDDHELDNLLKVCDEIFGAENKIGLMTILSNPRGSQNSRHLSYIHEYILMYAKNANELELKGISKSEDSLSEFNEVDENGRKYRCLGLRKRGGAWRKEDRPNMFYPIYINPENGKCSLDKTSEYTVEVIPKRPTGELSRWTWGKEKFVNEHSLLIGRKVNRSGETDSWDVFRKDYIDSEDGEEKTTKVKTMWLEKETNYQNAKNEIKALFGNSEVFDFPKPTYIMHQLASMMYWEDGDVVLDFFSGSSSTAQAIMNLNSEDGINRRFIMVQWPEEINEKSEAYKLGYRTIPEIGKERIRRAGDAIKKDNPESNIDTGFKVFKVADTNIKWNSLITSGQIDINQMETTPDTIDFMFGAKDIDIVYEIILRQRDVFLSERIEKLSEIGDRTYLYADAYLICLETEINNTLIDKIAAIDPVPVKFIFRDSAFKDDISLKDETFRRLKAVVEKNSNQAKASYTVEFI